jgi:hypothetical protein
VEMSLEECNYKISQQLHKSVMIYQYQHFIYSSFTSLNLVKSSRIMRNPISRKTTYVRRLFWKDLVYGYLMSLHLHMDREDDTGNPHGVLDDQPSSSHIELVALSTVTLVNKDFYFPDEKTENCILNVMLIRWNGDTAEQLTISQIHSDVCKELEPERKEITLA